MGKVLYFDAFNGVAGDMIVGGLIDLGVPPEHLAGQLERLPIDGFRLRVDRIERQGLRGVDFGVDLDAPSHQHDPHDHGPTGHTHDEAATWKNIRELIAGSRLSEGVRSRALAIFARLAGAEARVHGCEVEEVHFHEVGNVDSIVDIVGACIGFEYLAIDEFYASPLSLGGGTVHFSHGDWPVPAPATVELLKGLPTRMGPVDRELTTPTGAAIVAELASFDRPPAVVFEHSGLGAGDSQLAEIPNMLRLLLGRRQDDFSDVSSPDPAFPRSESVFLLEATIDDMDAETFGHVLERALEEGALEVFHTPVQMKKSRPGGLLSVLCMPEDRDRLARLIFRETTTLGLRVTAQDRWVLDRESREVPTQWGPVRVKTGRLNGEIVNVAPEYEDLREVARRSGRPLKRLRHEILSDFERLEE